MNKKIPKYQHDIYGRHSIVHHSVSWLTLSRIATAKWKLVASNAARSIPGVYMVSIPLEGASSTDKLATYCFLRTLMNAVYQWKTFIVYRRCDSRSRMRARACRVRSFAHGRSVIRSITKRALSVHCSNRVGRSRQASCYLSAVNNSDRFCSVLLCIKITTHAAFSDICCYDRNSFCFSIN